MTDKNTTQLVDMARQVIDSARQKGISAAEADIGSGTGYSVTVRLGEVEKIEHERDKALGITVYMGKRKGSASTSDFNPESIERTIAAACDIARLASEDKCAGLVDAVLMATEIPDLDLYHPWSLQPEQAIEQATECEKIARAYDKRINNSDGAVVSTYSGEHVYANTHGFANGWRWSSHMIDCTVIAEQSGSMQRDGWYSKCRDYHELQSIDTIAHEAARRTITKLGAKQISTRTVPVLFEAPVASGLFSAFITAISGGSLYRRASFLLDKLGEEVFSRHINIHERPHIPRALGSAAFDNDGVATREHSIVKNGILESYVLSGYSARKLNLQTTGNAGGIHNLVVEGHGENLESLLKKMGTGFLITDMIGFGVNQVTGDYSRGASGFWVENGEISFPVEEVTVAGNLRDMYKQIVAIGNDVDTRGNILTGSVLIDRMTIAGN